MQGRVVLETIDQSGTIYTSHIYAEAQLYVKQFIFTLSIPLTPYNCKYPATKCLADLPTLPVVVVTVVFGTLAFGTLSFGALVVGAVLVATKFSSQDCCSGVKRAGNSSSDMANNLSG